jgi:hypothetical protein
MRVVGFRLVAGFPSSVSVLPESGKTLETMSGREKQKRQFRRLFGECWQVRARK